MSLLLSNAKLLWISVEKFILQALCKWRKKGDKMDEIKIGIMLIKEIT